jgi:glutaminyl-tRNA synthetase
MAGDKGTTESTLIERGPNFIEEVIERHRDDGTYKGRVRTRFPPEPNGYLHIGHAKSICLNFGIAEKYNGKCNLRFDDTNPLTEDTDYVTSIMNDIRWLGFTWDGEPKYASDYFPMLFEFSERLIREGKAYVCSLSADEISAYRGDFNTPAKDSPYRTRSVDENLDLFRRMKAGEFKDGAHTLRAKIDMTSPNPVLRDPPLWRIRHAHHHRTGDAWCIYPLYDFTHGLSDAIEKITHSICTLEFENRRVLYDWCVESIFGTDDVPRQYEFARLNLTYTVMSKRKLLKLVEDGVVSGWDDPRMLTLSGLRRRGYSPASIRDLATRVGVTKTNSVIDMGVLEECVRDDLNREAPRAMAVLDPIKVTITNWPAGVTEMLTVPNHPQRPEFGTREVPFSGELFIERDDFMEVAPKGFFRLSPGKEVRLRSAYFVVCTDVVKDASGAVTELKCTYDPATKGGDSKERKVKGTLHWVSAPHAFTAPVRIYDRLFKSEFPDKTSSEKGEQGFMSDLNTDSLRVVDNAKLEPMLKDAAPGARFQFERIGYFVADEKDSSPGAPVFNRTVTLKDGWAKAVGK